jgi:radical SAM enzyme (TIGR01210 family)
MYLNIAPCSYGKCTFCAYNKMSDFRTPTSSELAKMMVEEYNKAKKEKRYFKVFNGGSWFGPEMPDWIQEDVYSFLEQRNYKWLRVENRVDKVDWNVMQALQKHGFDLTISWGLESVNQIVLDNVNKGIKIDSVPDILKTAKVLGVKNLVYILAGLPGVGVEDYVETLEWLYIRRHLIDEIVSLTYVPMKGSAIYDDLWVTNKHRVISKKDWEYCRQTARHMFFQTDIKLGFESYNWRYLHGKTFEEIYKYKAPKKIGQGVKIDKEKPEDIASFLR